MKRKKPLESGYSWEQYRRWQLGFRPRQALRHLFEDVRLLGRRPVLGRYKGVLEVRSHHADAGLFAIFTFVLNQLLYAERRGYLPVVRLGPEELHGKKGRTARNAYFDAAVGDNVWEYYFEPVAELSWDQLQEQMTIPGSGVLPGDVFRLTTEHLWYLHANAPDSLYAYNYGYYKAKEDLDPAWYERNRRLANRLIRRYIRVRPEILAELEAFNREHMAGRPVIGLHLRGTDKGTAQATSRTMRIVPPEEYFPHVDAFATEHPDFRLFCATDQRQFLARIRARYGERVLSLDAIRCQGDRAPFQVEDGKNYLKGKEVLLDCLLLSRCDFLLKCTSHVGEAAMWFSPEIPHIDLNHL